MFDILLSKMKEPSTWRGLAIVLGAFGITIAPALVDSITLAVTGVIGAIEIVRADSHESANQTKVP